jgi:hypothetical protein
MRCAVTIHHEPGAVVARCPDFPACEGRAADRDQAIERLRASVLFWLEACPCDTTADGGLVFEVTEERRA